MGEGLRGSNGAHSTLHRILVTPSPTHNQIGALWCWFPSGWACAHSRPLWVSPTTSPVRLGVSPAAAPTLTGIFNQRSEALFPRTGALGCAVCFAPRSLSGLSVRVCGATGSAIGQTAYPVRPTLRQSRSHHSNASPLRPGACLHPSYRSGCMFLFYLLGVGLPFRFSVSSGCARRRSVSTYASILVLQKSSALFSISPNLMGSLSPNQNSFQVTRTKFRSSYISWRVSFFPRFS